MSASLFSKFEGAGPDVPSFSGPLLIEVEDNGAAAAERPCEGLKSKDFDTRRKTSGSFFRSSFRFSNSD